MKFEPTKSPRTVLRRMLRLFGRSKRWGKGLYVEDSGAVTCYCLLGGLRLACAMSLTSYSVKPDVYQRVAMLIQGAINDVDPAGMTRVAPELARAAPDAIIAEWNDAPERTIGDIRAVLRAALHGSYRA